MSFHARRLVVLLTYRHYLLKSFEGGLLHPFFSREDRCMMLEHKRSIQAIFYTSEFVISRRVN